MNLTRKQELILIDLGLRWLLENLQSNPKTLGVNHAQPVSKPIIITGKTRRKWSPAQKAKFKATIAAKKKVAKKMLKTWDKPSK